MPVQAVRPEPDGLHDPAERARLDQLGSPGHRPHLEPLGEVDRPIFPTVRLCAFDRIELAQGDHARLVDHHVLAMAHRLDGDLSALARDAGGHDQLHLGVLEQRARVGDPLQIGKALDEAFERHRVIPAVEALALGAKIEQPADLMVDVPVIEPDRGELEERTVGHERVLESGSSGAASGPSKPRPAVSARRAAPWRP